MATGVKTLKAEHRLHRHVLCDMEANGLINLQNVESSWDVEVHGQPCEELPGDTTGGIKYQMCWKVACHERPWLDSLVMSLTDIVASQTVQKNSIPPTVMTQVLAYNAKWLRTLANTAPTQVFCSLFFQSELININEFSSVLDMLVR